MKKEELKAELESQIKSYNALSLQHLELLSENNSLCSRIHQLSKEYQDVAEDLADLEERILRDDGGSLTTLSSLDGIIEAHTESVLYLKSKALIYRAYSESLDLQVQSYEKAFDDLYAKPFTTAFVIVYKKLKRCLDKS